MERGLLTPLKTLRRQVFVEVARVAFETDHDDIKDAIEAIPYKITPGDKPLYRESIWRERAICSERVRLALGLSLRPEGRARPPDERSARQRHRGQVLRAAADAGHPLRLRRLRAEHVQGHGQLPRLRRASLHDRLPEGRRLHRERSVGH